MKNEDMTRITKTDLADTLKKLMMNRPFSSITVTEIVKTCGINRKTFYYHFEDIYALLQWTLHQEGIEAMRRMDLPDNYSDAVSDIMEYVQRNQFLLNCAYDSLGRQGLKQFFYEDLLELTQKIIEKTEVISGSSYDPEFKTFLIRYHAEALAGILLAWIVEKDFPNKEKTTQYLSRVLEMAEKTMQNQK